MQCGNLVTLTLDRHRSQRGSVVPCGRCMACRVNSRRKKTGRLLLESLQHVSNSFCTLTETDEAQLWRLSTLGEPVPTLSPKRFTNWLKRFRHVTGPGLRFAAVGEYGDERGRPHYHLILFGQHHDEIREALEESWEFGATETAPLTVERAQYLAGYTVKKMTKGDDDRLDGQAPEFYRQSLRPAIGCDPRSLSVLEELHTSRGGAHLIGETGDVAMHFRIGQHGVWPLDRTLRRKIRDQVGLVRPVVGSGLEVPTEDEERAAKHRSEKAGRRHARRVTEF